MEQQMEAAEYLKRPYGRLLLPDPDRGYAAEIVEFPGCVAIGETPTEALSSLDEVAVEWIEASLEQGQEIPEPFETTEFSGRVGFRMGHHLHKRAAYFAQRDGISLNQFIVNCVSEQVGMRARPASPRDEGRREVGRPARSAMYVVRVTSRVWKLIRCKQLSSS